MHENIYSYNETINGINVWLIFKPNFREDVAILFKEDSKEQYESDGEIVFKKDNDPRYERVYVSEEAEWFLVKEVDGTYCCYRLSVTEKTQKITTSLGEEWNKEFNRMLQKAKKDYYKKKKEEIRLYFYDSKKDRLSLCCPNNSFLEDLKYSLDRGLIQFFSIDKRFSKPESYCFILGRTRKTIGLKNSELMDFIEPVYEIELDFEKEEFDFGEYANRIESLKSKILELLKFYIENEHKECIKNTRIAAYIKSENEKNIDDTISAFKSEIWNSFVNGDLKAIRKLYNVMYTPQDCSNVEFELRLKKEVEYSPSTEMEVYFVNGEEECKTAEWIAKNISRCKDRNVVYFELRNRYNFF